MDDLYPDGQDLICGELPLLFGKRLVIDCGAFASDVPVQEWHGLVRAEVRTQVHRSCEYPDEYDVRITVAAVSAL